MESSETGSGAASGAGSTSGASRGASGPVVASASAGGAMASCSGSVLIWTLLGLDGEGEGEAGWVGGSASLRSLGGARAGGGGGGGEGDGGGEASTGIMGRWRTSKSDTLVV